MTVSQPHSAGRNTKKSSAARKGRKQQASPPADEPTAKRASLDAYQRGSDDEVPDRPPAAEKHGKRRRLGKMQS